MLISGHLRLAKARNEHGKARSERAALSERCDSLVANSLRLEEKLGTYEESDRGSKVELDVIKQTNERLEDELREARTKTTQLEAKLEKAREHKDALHDAELKVRLP